MIVGIGLVLPGCSLFLVHGPPPGHEAMAAFECSESKVLPTLDALGAGWSLVGAVRAEDDQPSGDFFDYTLSREENIVASLGLVMILGASAWSGFDKVGDCRDAQAKLRSRLGQAVTPGPGAADGDADSVQWMVPGKR